MPNTFWDHQQMRNPNGSNMSLNLPPSYFQPQQQPPQAWMNNWGAPNMYPYPVGMVPVMNQGKANLIY